MTDLPSRVLHVEDDQDFQGYVAALLTGIAGVTAVSSLQEGRAAISGSKYDVVIVDFTLPDGSGSELVSELAEKYPSIPVIVFSAHEVTDTMKNVVRVFVKGRFVDQELTDTVRGLCS